MTTFASIVASQLWCAMLILAQAESPAADITSAPAGGLGGNFGFFLPLALIGIMFYFMVLIPERKKRKQLEETLGNLKKNDPVITSGGICGVVVNASPGSKYVTLRIDESNPVRFRVLRSHIAHVGPHDEVAEKDIVGNDKA